MYLYFFHVKMTHFVKLITILDSIIVVSKCSLLKIAETSYGASTTASEAFRTEDPKPLLDQVVWKNDKYSVYELPVKAARSDDDDTEVIDLDEEIKLENSVDELYADQFTSSTPSTRRYIQKQYPQCMETYLWITFCERGMRNAILGICSDPRCPEKLPSKIKKQSTVDCNREYWKRRGVKWDPPDY